MNAFEPFRSATTNHHQLSEPIEDSSKLPVNHRQKLFANGTLLIGDLNEVTDSGEYSCQARAAGNSELALNHVQISIKGKQACSSSASYTSPHRPLINAYYLTCYPVPPVVEPFMFAKSLHRGQRYNIMCTVVRGDLPVTIRWFKDARLLLLPPPPELNGGINQLAQPQTATTNSAGQSLASVDKHRWTKLANSAATTAGLADSTGIAIKQLDPYSSTLTFSSLQSNHRGLYTCEATNEAGRANQSSALVIQGKSALAMIELPCARIVLPLGGRAMRTTRCCCCCQRVRNNSVQTGRSMLIQLSPTERD